MAEKLLEKIILSATLLFAAPAAAEEPKQLYVNPSEIHYTLEHSRDNGEKDIQKLTEPEDSEESWIFVKYKNNKQVWHENGDNGHSAAVAFDLGVLDDVLEKAKDIKEISFYHQHPVFEPGKGIAVDYSQVPSANDIATDINFLEHVYASAPEVLLKIDTRIITSTGVYRIKYDPRVCYSQAMKNTAHWARMKMLLETADLSSKTSLLGLDYSFGNKENYAKQNKEYAKRYSNESFKMEFKEIR